jgi:hypothetical protein
MLKLNCFGSFLSSVVPHQGFSFLMLHQRKIISTIDMENARERNVPLLIMFAYCALMFGLFLYKAPTDFYPSIFMRFPLLER